MSMILNAKPICIHEVKSWPCHCVKIHCDNCDAKNGMLDAVRSMSTVTSIVPLDVKNGDDEDGDEDAVALETYSEMPR